MAQVGADFGQAAGYATTMWAKPKDLGIFGQGKVFHDFFHDVLMLNLEEMSMFHHGKHHGKHIFHLLNLKDLDSRTNADVFHDGFP